MNNIYTATKQLITYAIDRGLIEECDKICATNKILEILKLDDIPEGEVLANDDLESVLAVICDYAAEKGATAIIKGLRAMSDFEYEFQMALMNNKLNSDVETVFMMTSAEYSYLSSSSVKQVAFFDGSVEGLVPSMIIGDLKEKVRKVK